MILRRALVMAAGGLVLVTVGLPAAEIQSTQAVVTSPTVFVPAVPPPPKAVAGSLPGNVVVWDATTKETNVTADAAFAHFTFDFTNVSTSNLTIITVHPSCGCTTTELPPLPWTVGPGNNGRIRATVNVAGKTGLLFKSIDVATDRGTQLLMLKIAMLEPVMPTLTAADRARNVDLAKVDRQAVFRGDCVKCHVTPGNGKYGKALFDADCAICHESEHRATMVPDLHQLKQKTNPQFWLTWIAHGKPGTLMPAFSLADGGPLSDIQIASLANYLAATVQPQTSANQ